MTFADIAAAYWAAALVGSCAIAAVLLLRRPLRHFFGAGAAYLAWVAVPMAIIAERLPMQGATSEWGSGLVLSFHALGTAAQASAKQAATSASFPAWLTVWAVGSLLLALVFVVEHRRMLRALGPLRLSVKQDVHLTHGHHLGPLALGLLRPRIVLPSDFATRYTEAELDLILAHERVHIRRHDPLANVLWALSQCVFWFIPLVHVAARQFRIDQELACDAAVVRRYPHARRTYAEAIYKTQHASMHVTPLCCQWQLVHPIKERILNLKDSRNSTRRRVAGQLVVTTFAVLTTYGAWATQSTSATPAAAGPSYDLQVSFAVDGKVMSPKLRVQAGEPLTVNFTDSTPAWSARLTATPTGKSLMVASTIKRGDEVVAEPTLLVPQGGPAVSATISADAKHPEIRLQIGAAAPSAR